MIRIVHVTSGLGVGGAETMLYRLLSVMANNENQEHLVITLTPGCKFDFDRIGVKVKVVDLKELGVLGLFTLRRVVHSARPDIVQGWMYHGNIAATFCAPSGVPVVWGIHHSLHDLCNEKLSIRVLVMLGRWLSRYSRTRRIIYVSETSSTHHINYGYRSDKALVIPNGFDCNYFRSDPILRAATRLRLGLEPYHLLVGSFGRFHPVKDHKTLICAFAQVVDRIPTARLALAGGGIDDSNDALVSLLAFHGVADKVILLGLCDDMPALYNALDLYALSSVSESFPNVLGESCAVGVPCVTTDVGDAARIVEGTGRAVPPGDSRALAQAMAVFLEQQPAQRISAGERARTHILAHFSLAAAVSAYNTLYDGLTIPSGEGIAVTEVKPSLISDTDKSRNLSA
jgi:glycosyltransferase involved in cell wall biosynthesis